MRRRVAPDLTHLQQIVVVALHIGTPHDRIRIGQRIADRHIGQRLVARIAHLERVRDQLAGLIGYLPRIGLFDDVDRRALDHKPFLKSAFDCPSSSIFRTKLGIEIEVSPRLHPAEAGIVHIALNRNQHLIVAGSTARIPIRHFYRMIDLTGIQRIPIVITIDVQFIFQLRRRKQACRRIHVMQIRHIRRKDLQVLQGDQCSAFIEVEVEHEVSYAVDRHLWHVRIAQREIMLTRRIFTELNRTAIGVVAGLEAGRSIAVLQTDERINRAGTR